MHGYNDYALSILDGINRQESGKLIYNGEEVDFDWFVEHKVEMATDKAYDDGFYAGLRYWEEG